jgi:prepilin-type processing-associated H-X9-DG protein
MSLRNHEAPLKSDFLSLAHLRHSAGTAANVFFIDGHVRPCDPARLHHLGLQRFFSEDKQVIQ